MLTTLLSKSLHQRTIELTNTTALFMHAANPTQQAEWRGSSLKGILRYWFRAVYGAYYDLSNVRNKEAELFGSTQTGSRLWLTTNQLAYNNSTSYLLPHKDDERDKSRSPAFSADRNLQFAYSCYPPNSNSPSSNSIAWVTWVAVNLGGFGQRARRGAGSLRLVNVNPPIENMPLVGQNLPTDLQELKTKLEQGISEARRNITAPTTPNLLTLNAIANFPILHPRCASIQLVHLLTNDEEDARRQVMLALRSYKSPGFGLPYIRPKRQDQAIYGKRQASPLHIHITPLASGGFGMVQTVLKSRFENPAHQDYTTIQNYLDSFPNRLQVQL